MSTTTTTIHASSPLIKYSQHWSLNKSDGSMATNNVGASANLTFTGSSVRVFGTLPANNQQTIQPMSSYSLDGGLPVVFDASNFGEPSKVDNFAFYQSDPGLTNENHSLVITSIKDNANLILDNIIVISGAGSSSVPPVFPSITITPLPPSTPSSPSPSASTIGSTSKINVGGIVGGIIAALVMLAGLVAFFLVRRRRNQRIAKRREATPFVPAPNGPSLTPPSHGWESYNVPTPQPRYDEKERLPEISPGPLSLVRHGSMYKPRTDSDNLPPMEFGYGRGV
ncbi:hypothetical protein F5890DRAFT_1484874 [Lentinula detonsa]|uniref:Uncharacterized protein n=1 Tax=Lentinula detonsa TaxID=2804962 RepID=A0AA38Q9Q2_9AGAR|nr:hypothetical protein F5890DRAFT_1484874 [Lentinula detonsa]